ncbi:lipase family protein [Luteimicrobium sp. NPDC057192]|uniref:lipase family protein n=1 Tax=Luteimicrobium sp. NPDC057192 TaxID=3346042 RepID=UPI00363D772D
MRRSRRRGQADPGRPAAPIAPRRRVVWVGWVVTCCVAVASALAACGDDGGRATASAAATDFYQAPSSVPSEPGVLLRSEPLTRDEIPTEARGWRILYTTSAGDGAPTVSSGVVLVPRSGPTTVHHVVAWAHGTTGVADDCAPSRMADGLEAGGLTVAGEALRRGWALVATDYVGLGTPGEHPYVVGQPAGRSVLDAVRAARQLDVVGPRTRTVLWGYSEGGGAALWADKLAPTYAPELAIDGVAAVAPASNLPGIIDDLPVVPTSAVYVAYVLAAYTSTYDDVTYAMTVQPDAVMTLKRLAHLCLDDPRAAELVGASGLLDRPVWAEGPEAGRLRERLAENVPSGRMVSPVLLLQGAADSLVTPDSQAAYVSEQCASGSTLDYREYPDTTHGGIVEASSPATRDLVRWTAARFDGGAARSTCGR